MHLEHLATVITLNFMASSFEAFKAIASSFMGNFNAVAFRMELNQTSTTIIVVIAASSKPYFQFYVPIIQVLIMAIFYLSLLV